MRLLLATLAIAGAMTAAVAARSTRHWGGADLPLSCETVRGYQDYIKGMSAETRASLARQFHISRKMQRQARACLRRDS